MQLSFFCSILPVVMKMYADVLVEICNKHVDKTFTYHIPKTLEEDAEVGKRVLVLFGSQQIEGYILALKNNSDVEAKDLLEILDEEPVLNEEMLELGKFLQEKTLSSLSNCYSAMLPKALKASKKTQIHKKEVLYLSLTEELEEALEKVTSASQKDVLALFENETRVLKTKANKVSASAVNTLIKNGILNLEKEEVYRYQIKNQERESAKVLNEEQQSAKDKIIASLQKSEIFLLHGVTGSGKTEVYLSVIEEVLKLGKEAIVLVPEISLTPQFVGVFSKRFPNDIAVLHSHLSDGEKYDEWRKILKGEVHICIGARSASFAPFTNLGIIIMDEEHSESYKQESSPRYFALDVLKKRSQTHHCPLVLGSATPTLDSMAHAHKKLYTYLPMKKRAQNAVLPECILVDMAEEVKNRHPIISRELECSIIEKLNQNEQIMLLLNRRGHSTTITCSNCGFTYRCPHCEISLTYHKSSKNLRCHYCGYTKYIDEYCPNCHEKSLNYYGLGTEKLEEYLENIFPTARIVRMDRDSTTNKGTLEKITEDFLNHKYDILLGTQMISKGLDFPNVTLMGILDADASLQIPDYKSNERTFALLSQASGRAGRKEKKGMVILQTFQPENYIFQCVKEHSYFKFYKYEMNIRKTLKYPPFYYLVLLTFKSKDYTAVRKEALKAKEFLEQNKDPETILLGPTTANMFLVNGIYHFEILIKYRFDDKLINTIKELDEFVLLNKKVTMDIDFHY